MEPPDPSIGDSASEGDFSFNDIALDAPWGIVVGDANGRTLWINRAFTAMCGYTAEEMFGLPPGHILQGPETSEAAAAALRRAVREQTPCHAVLLNYHKNGTRYWADIHLMPVKNGAGECTHFVAMTHEITQQRNKELALENCLKDLYGALDRSVREDERRGDDDDLDPA